LFNEGFKWVKGFDWLFIPAMNLIDLNAIGNGSKAWILPFKSCFAPPARKIIIVPYHE